MNDDRAYYNEFDTKAAAWLRELIKQGHIMEGDVDDRSITEVQPSDLAGYTRCHFFAGIGGWDYALRLAGWGADRPVWTGSCPCQPFSAAGKRKGAADERHLWPEFHRLIRECRPPVVLGEQVASAIAHGWLDRLCDDMEGIGYACGAAVLPACSVGTPHGRERLWWVASDPQRLGVEGLVPTADTREARPWRQDCEAYLHAIADRPFAPGAGWPQPLLRPVDDGLPARVVGCAGAGNAIVPQVAAAFIVATTTGGGE